MIHRRHLVDVHQSIDAGFIASMADHLETALSWRVDMKPSIPVLRYRCTDDVQRILVMENLPLPASMTKRESAPQDVADLARRNTLLALRATPSSVEDLKEAFRQLGNFAIVGAERMRCVDGEKVLVRAPTPWSPASVRCVSDPSRPMGDPSILDLAPPLYEIGTSGDSSLADTSLALYTSSATDGPVDVIAAMRAMNEITAWHASRNDGGPRPRS